MDYIKRIIDKDLDLRVKAFGGINIVGPKGCGKTRTAKERCRTIIELEDEDKRRGYLKTIKVQPSLLLENKTPILFDEWQDAPEIWGLIRKRCDDTDCFGDYFLTGSTSKKILTPHSGTTRISTVQMYPMSLYEYGKSNGEVSLKDMFDNPNKTISSTSKLTLKELIDLVCIGGWPKTLQIKDDDAKKLIAQDYYQQLIQNDVIRIDNKKKKQHWVQAILKSYARNIGTLCKKNVIYKDASENFGFTEETFDTYVEALQDLYVIKDYDAWTPQIRSEKSLRAPKKHMFIDPSIAIASLNLSPKYFYNDLDFFGHIFESLVFRDLSVYSQGLKGQIYHYHDKFDLEGDAVLFLEDGRYAIIEIKLGTSEIDKAESNLLKIKYLIEENNKDTKKIKIREPDLLLVITASEFAFSLPSGVKVVPIACLKD